MCDEHDPAQVQPGEQPRQVACEGIEVVSPARDVRAAVASPKRTMRTLLATGFRQRQPEWTETQVQRAVADRILHASTG